MVSRWDCQVIDEGDVGDGVRRAVHGDEPVEDSEARRTIRVCDRAVRRAVDVSMQRDDVALIDGVHDASGVRRFGGDDEVESGIAQGASGTKRSRQTGARIGVGLTLVAPSGDEVVDGDEPTPTIGGDVPVVAAEADRGVGDLVDSQRPTGEQGVADLSVVHVDRLREHAATVTLRACRPPGQFDSCALTE